jgi:hypothetical protein
MVFLEFREGWVFVFRRRGGGKTVIFFRELSVGCFDAGVFLVKGIVIFASVVEEIFNELFVGNEGLVVFSYFGIFVVKGVVPILELSEVVDARSDGFFLLVVCSLGKKEEGSFDVFERSFWVD